MKKLKILAATLVMLQAGGVSAAAVQAGAFAVPSNASRMLDRISALGYKAVAVPKNGLQIVRIENMSGSAARSACNTLESSGISCFVSGAAGVGRVAHTPRYKARPRAVAPSAPSVEVLSPNTQVLGPDTPRAAPTYVGGSGFDL